VELAEVTDFPERMRMSEIGLQPGVSMAISVRTDRLLCRFAFERQWMGSVHVIANSSVMKR
jgi:hypothetical protein